MLATGLILGMSCLAMAQGSFAPQVGLPGSTAIPADSSCFRDWAIACDATLGPQQAGVSNSPTVSSGAPTYAIGKADAPLTLSLGDGGEATLQFSAPIYDGPGFDFAVFENGFLQGEAAFLELAFVEVSSNGMDFFRFPAISETDTSTQVASFEVLDASQLHNLAGKYIAQFGTPFDLSELPDTILLDKANITHVRIIDCIGSIDPSLSTRDAEGHIINDPWPTNFESGGFDLDGVGVINSRIPLGISEHTKTVRRSGPTFDILGRPMSETPSNGLRITNQAIRYSTNP
jgi:hypothetical protein